MFTHTCEICGKAFESKSNIAKYCPDCRNKAQVKRNKAHAEKRRSGLAAEIGSEQICPFCQKPYIVVTGSQKCCGDCRKKQANANKIASNSEYTKNNYEAVKFYVPKRLREQLKAYAESQGLSVNKLISISLEEYKKNHG